jgi:cytochrome c556
MRIVLLTTAGAALLLSACNGGGADGNTTLAEANASGNQASAAIENAVQQSNATPLQKELALALMKERHENYEKIGKAMRAANKAIGSNDLPAVRQAAATVNELAPKAAGWFPAGTGPDIGKTDARAEIWQQPQQFAAGMKDFQAAAAAFHQAAQGTDVAAMKAAHGKLGGTCKSCHDRFKTKD